MPEPTKKAGPLTTEPADTHEHKYTDAKEIEQAFSDFVRDNSFTEVSAGVFRGLDPLTGHALKVDTLAHIIRDLVNGEAWTEDAIDDEGKPAAFFASRAAKPAAAPAPILAAQDADGHKLFTDLSFQPGQESIDSIKAGLKFNRKGNPLNTIENLSLILSLDPGFLHIARFDRATGAIKHSPSFHGIDHLYAEITKYLSETYNLETTVPKIDWLVNFLAYRDSINSVIILYRRLGPSPEENPLGSILGKIVLKDPETLSEFLEAMDLFFKKAALQVFVPELSDKVFPNDIIPILKGPQGIGKTLIIKSFSLSPEAYYDAGSGSMDDIATRDGFMKLAGLDICELGEFRMHNVVERLKSLASLTTFVFRPPYGRGNVTIPRTTSYIGSTNAEEFLLDGTGNRRYFPFSVVKIDFSLFHDDAYLFRQLRAWYRDWAIKFIRAAGEDLERQLFSIHESEALTAYLAKGREEARVISPSEDLVEEYIECVQDAVNRMDFDKLRGTRPTSAYWKEYYSAIEAAKLIFPSGRIPNDFYRVFGEVMAARDFTYARIKISGRQFRAWTPKRVTGDTVTPPSEHVESDREKKSIDIGIENTGCHPSPESPELFKPEPEKPAPPSPSPPVPTSEQSEDEALLLQGKDLIELEKIHSHLQREHVLMLITRGPPYSTEERSDLRNIYGVAR